MIQLNQNQNNGNELNQVDRNFVNAISNKLTLFGQIPYNIPVPMIVEVIKSSARYFYKYHQNSWKQTYYIVKRDDIIGYAGTDNFMFLGLTINPRICVIKEIYEANTPEFSSVSGAMYETAKYNLKNDAFGASINNNLFMIEASVRMIEARAFDNIFSSRIPYDFSPNSSELMLKRPPKADLVLDCFAHNDISCLYDDSLFERHVLGNTKKELKRLLAGHTFNLPGGVTLTADEICNNIEDVEKVEELIKSGSGVGDIILKRR